jgi:hypothetical protein
VNPSRIRDEILGALTPLVCPTDIATLGAPLIAEMLVWSLSKLTVLLANYFHFLMRIDVDYLAVIVLISMDELCHRDKSVGIISLFFGPSNCTTDGTPAATEMNIWQLFKLTVLSAKYAHFLLTSSVINLAIVVLVPMNRSAPCNEVVLAASPLVPRYLMAAKQASRFLIEMMIWGLPKFAVNRADNADPRLTALIRTKAVIILIVVYFSSFSDEVGGGQLDLRNTVLLGTKDVGTGAATGRASPRFEPLCSCLILLIADRALSCRPFHVFAP